MPQPSYAYAVARIRVLESRLLNKEKLERMLDAGSPEDALKVLGETSYAQSLTELKNPYEYEILLSREIEKTARLIDEISPNPELTHCFFLKYDFHNLKVLLKNRILESDEDTLLVNTGVIPVDQLKTAVREKDYRELPVIMREAAEKVDELLNFHGDSGQIDILLDRALYEAIFEVVDRQKDDFLSGYFQRQIDLLNIQSFLRVKKINGDKALLDRLLLPRGKVDTGYLLESIEGPAEKLIENFAYTEYGPVVTEGVQSFVKTGRISQFEKLMENHVLDYIKKKRGQTMGIVPIIAYLLAKETEIKSIRMIMVGLINRIDPQLIRERLRECYA